MKILIIGASSFIGNRLYNYLIDNGNFCVKGTYYKNKKKTNLVYLDITDKQLIKTILNDEKPNVVLWIAGSKNLKFCESDIENAKRLNTYPISSYIEISKELNLKEHFIYLSTDYIFDGKKGSFSDADIPNPNTNYGISNYLAEKYIQHSHLFFSIIRTSAVMGVGGTFFDWITKELKKKQDIELFDDTYFSPTAIMFLVKNIMYIINNKEYGTFNICNEEKINRYEFVLKLKDLDKKFIANVLPVSAKFKNIPYFQNNLTMVPSVITLHCRDRNLMSYLKGELE